MDQSQIKRLALRLLEGLGIERQKGLFDAKAFFELAVASAPIEGVLPSQPDDLLGFQLAQNALYEMRANRPNLRTDGVLYIGRPSFLSDELLTAITDELEAKRVSAKHDRWGQFLGKPGPHVRSLLSSRMLGEFVESFVGQTCVDRRASCIYYDRAGAHIRPHVDTDHYGVNANLLVKHSGANLKSKLIIYTVGGEPKEMLLKPFFLEEFKETLDDDTVVTAEDDEEAFIRSCSKAVI